MDRNQVLLLISFAGICQAICQGPNLFSCDDNTCITMARVCDGGNDCPNGEDEGLKAGCVSGSPTCKPKNPRMVSSNGYICRNRTCNPSRGNSCRARRKRCICDDECGYACVNPESSCSLPIPRIPYMNGYDIIRVNGSDRITVSGHKPFRYRDMIRYRCRSGRVLIGLLPRCTAKKIWSRQLPRCEDFRKCGQAGKKQAKLARVVGGENAAENAWPWQALISKNSSSMKQSLQRSHLVGGGSILNQKWLLTAAHVFADAWQYQFVVFVGIFERPLGNHAVKNSVEAYSLEEYFRHHLFNPSTFSNDIALIKLGNKLDKNLNPIEGQTGGLTFGHYIRPVCLPCTGTCLKKKHLVGDGGVSLINDDLDSMEKCRVEEKKLLHSRGAKIVVTGFGHLNVRFMNGTEFNPPKKLQQALLRIEPEDTCRQGISEINEQLALYYEYNRLVMEYADSMICCKSAIPGRIVDACEGDSGGPMVREVRETQTGESCWVQIGIVSFGGGCGLNFPGYYTNVARFIPWMNETMGGILPGPAEPATCEHPAQGDELLFVGLSDGLHPEGTSLRAQCVEGFSLVGDEDVRCLENGSWSEFPFCERVETSDFTKCGQAGEVGSIKKQTRFVRAVGGEDAAENAWPWQALITSASSSMKESLSNRYLLAGGSILNKNWILTAASVLQGNAGRPGDQWLTNYVIYVGIFERPGRGENVKKSVEAYSFGEYIPHQEFDIDTLVYDIALIKLGNQLDGYLNPIEGQTGGLTFGYYIRPVCLPCTGTCLKEKHLYDLHDGVSLVNDDMDSIEKCRVEEQLLHSPDAKAVVTGFGHLDISLAMINVHNFNPPKKLQQALLKIESDDTCEQGIRDINELVEQDLLEYTDSMMCCKSGIPGRIVDSCVGDHGGPLVREVRDEKTGESCWVQLGIVSFGYGCGSYYPGYYTKVARFIPWINDTMGGILPGP